MFRKRDTHIHFVGIGGIGMSGIAEVLLNSGYTVTGTNVSSTETTQRLVGLGATVHRGHGADRLADADVVVVSSAIAGDNPEILAARARHIPVIPRAEMLAELMRLKQGLLIAGSHGKTTTTSLVAAVIYAAGHDPTVVIGGKVNSFDSNARLGYGDVLVAEADESDGSFLYLTPTLAIITNIDAEHLDHYGSMDALLDAFVGFANRVPFYGMSIVCTDDANVRAILPRLHKRTITYGLDGGADYVADEIVFAGTTTHFRVRAHGIDQGTFTLHMPGAHNVCNALATIALCDEQQVHVEVTRRALADFCGVQRRFTFRGEARGVTVIDDYGHHPTEIRATLAGARTAFVDRRLVAAIQPHRYTRVRDNFDGFVSALDEANLVVITDVYSAGEQPIAGIDSGALAAALRRHRPDRPVIYAASIDDMNRALVDAGQPGDVVLTLGAGSITRVSRMLVESLGGTPC